MDIVTDLQALRKPCQPVNDEDGLPDLAIMLIVEMHEHNGQGLAANQIGINKRAFVMINERGTVDFIANPEIIRVKGAIESNEGCLSLPGQIVRVKRPKEVTIRGTNQYRRLVKYKLSGILARRACHEIDHLDGKLIIDY